MSLLRTATRAQLEARWWQQEQIDRLALTSLDAAGKERAIRKIMGWS